MSEQKGARLIGARRHHTSALGCGGDYDRLAAQLWMIALLD
jgi:hypothetical protein